MAVNRRLLFWVIKAYIRKSWRSILISFLLGLTFFFVLLYGFRYFHSLLPVSKKVSIGIVGAYTQDNLPPIVMERLSRGLTKVAADGSISPDIASSWKISDNGKAYTFYLKPDLTFTNGKRVDAASINYNFADVAIEKPDKRTIVFKLKDAYAPFLITVSKPIFSSGFTGVSDYTVENIKLNGNFVQSITLVSTKNRFDTIRYQFYPSEEALKMAFLLGEISQAVGLTNTKVKDTDFTSFHNTQVKQETDYTHLVTLFFNTTDETLSDKKLRLALTYAMPQTFATGEKAFLPYSPKSIFYHKALPKREQDIVHAKELLGIEADTKPEKKYTLTIATLKKHTDTAKAIAASWKQLGVETKVEEVEGIPSKFQIFLGDFSIPRDPDQYTLWHSDQMNNITQYKNLRIDKLLEDGRKVVDLETRKKLYTDFQKYLMDDSPAWFLYFPTEYQLTKK
ncbi:MAG: ABC transporter substrate-binding protein [Patescibacteria group bacterium]